MVESTGPTVVAPAEDEKSRALTNYRKKLVEYRDIEQQLKQLRKKEAETQKSFDKSENDIKSLQSVGQIVGEVLKQLTEEKFIVKATNGPRYVVGCRRSINKEALKQGTRVALDMTTLTIMLSHEIEIFDLRSKNALNSHSVTPDFIPLHLIKRTAHCLALPLELLFNLSYMRSEVPSRWRHSFIVPVPKKPPFSNPSNYRPISVTSVFARLFEKIVKGKVTTYLNRKQSYSHKSARFLNGALPSFNVTGPAHLIPESLLHVRGDIFDFCREALVDRVPHRKLTAKLESLGIYPLIVRWIESIGSERFSRSYKIGSVTLESVQEIKDLGFIFSNKLGFETHYKTL
ncbi:hypothetical protein COOONC_20020, partial [Cooperia oncophora]